MKELKNVRFSNVSGQKVGNGRIPKNPDVPRKNTNPKDGQGKLPPKKKQTK